jgi:cytochrome P450
MICELLGVPYQDRGSFQEQVDSFLSGETSDEDQIAAYTATQHYLAELVAAKRANPTDDVLSDLTDEELRGVALILLAAGLDTTANMLALGTFALLRNPAQPAALRADPALADRAVEELLRYLSVAKTFMRTALEDVELGGQTIKAGTTVILSYNTANRDPERFADPHVLDLRRQDGGHLAFGHGIHQCLGQQLARVEMRVAFPALLNRFPTLRLAVPAEEVGLRPETADIYRQPPQPRPRVRSGRRCARRRATRRSALGHGRPRPEPARTRPDSYAKTTACTRSRSSSLVSNRLTCVLTVPSAT